jgi:hypothetical protein
MKLLNPAKRRDYVLEADRGSQQPTVFVLRRLTREEFLEFSALAPFTLDQAARIQRITQAARAEGRDLDDAERRELATVVPDIKAASRLLVRAHEYAAARGVAEIRDLVDEDLRPLEMSVAEFLRFAPADVVQELGSAVIEWSVLTEAERKNSGAQSAPGSPAPTAQSAQESTISPTGA